MHPPKTEDLTKGPILNKETSGSQPQVTLAKDIQMDTGQNLDYAPAAQFMQKILVIGDSIPEIAKGFELTMASQWNQTLAERTFAAIIIHSDDIELIDTTLQQLRQSEKTALGLIYTTTETRLSESLSDGYPPHDMAGQIAQFEKRLAWLHPDLVKAADTNLEKKIICYLWLNKARRIAPQRVLATRSMYRYSLIDLWDDYPSKEFWLASAEKSELLKKEHLIDRVRACQNCNSGMLNYIDTCPSCQSIDIQNESAIHCFTCGHIASQQLFLRQNNLVCPNCLTKLRHIGTDYDRPLENQSCNSCNNLFVEAQVRARCLYCDHDNDLDDLKIHHYYTYSLGNLGITQAKTGSDQHLLPEAMGDALPRDRFSWMIEWVKNLAPRQNTQHLVMGLRLNNLVELSTQESEIELLNHLEEFARRFRSVLRRTDVFCRYAPDVVLFLLPDAEEKDMDTVKKRIERITSEQSSNPLDISILICELPTGGQIPSVDNWLRLIYEELIEEPSDD